MDGAEAFLFSLLASLSTLQITFNILHAQALGREWELAEWSTDDDGRWGEERGEACLVVELSVTPPPDTHPLGVPSYSQGSVCVWGECLSAIGPPGLGYSTGWKVPAQKNCRQLHPLSCLPLVWYFPAGDSESAGAEKCIPVFTQSLAEIRSCWWDVKGSQLVNWWYFHFLSV